MMNTNNLTLNEVKEHTDKCTETGVDWTKFKKDIQEELAETNSVIDVDWLIYDVLILKAECLANKKLLSYCQHLEDQLFRLKNKEAKLEV